MIAWHFVLRVTRYGPLVPGRLWWCDHEPGCPSNRLDRGRLSLYPRADIAGLEVPPEQLADRLYSMTDPRPAHPPTHWRYAKPISQEEYNWRFSSLRWAEQHQPDHPVLQPRTAVAAADLPLPDFERENAEIQNKPSVIDKYTEEIKQYPTEQIETMVRNIIKRDTRKLRRQYPELFKANRKRA